MNAAPPLSRRLVVVNGVLALVVAIGLGVAAAYNQTAAVVVSVAATKLVGDYQLKGGSQAGSAFASGAVEVQDSINRDLKATGTTTRPPVAASGQVVFTYDCSTSPCADIVSVPGGTVVATLGGARFATQAGMVVNSPHGATAVAVKSLQPGDGGNVAAGLVTLIENPPNPSLKASNPTAMTGGLPVNTFSSYTAADIDAARSATAVELGKRLLAALTAKAAGRHLVPDGSPSLQSTGPKAGDAVDAVAPTLTLAGTLRGLAFDEAAVHSLSRAKLAAMVPAGYQLTSDPVRTSYTVSAATADGNVTLETHAQAWMMASFHADRLRTSLPGRSPADARGILGKLTGVVGVSVRQGPLQLPFLPLVDSHIAIKVVEARPLATQ